MRRHSKKQAEIALASTRELVPLEVHFDLDGHRDGIALLHRRLEAIQANCVHRLLIEIRRQRSLHIKTLGHSLAVYDQTDHGDAMPAGLACLPSCILRKFGIHE